MAGACGCLLDDLRVDFFLVIEVLEDALRYLAIRHSTSAEKNMSNLVLSISPLRLGGSAISTTLIATSGSKLSIAAAANAERMALATLDAYSNKIPVWTSARSSSSRWSSLSEKGRCCYNS